MSQAIFCRCNVLLPVMVTRLFSSSMSNRSIPSSQLERDVRSYPPCTLPSAVLTALTHWMGQRLTTRPLCYSCCGTFWQVMSTANSV